MYARLNLTGLQVDSLVCLGDIEGTRLIQCKCIECGTLQQKQKSKFKALYNGRISRGFKHLPCVNELCKYHSYNVNTYSVGTIHGCLKIIEVLKYDTVKVQCIYCDFTRVFQISSIRQYNHCRNKGCKGYKAFIRPPRSLNYNIGDIYNNMQLLSFNRDNNHYLVECIECGEQFEVVSTDFKDNAYHCRNVNCPNYGRLNRAAYLVGSIRHNLKCLRYLEHEGQRKVEVQCQICNAKDIKKASAFSKGEARCKYHPQIYGRFKGLFNSFRIEANAYTYKEDDYFICSCTKCGYRDILTAAEMLQHKCEERN